MLDFDLALLYGVQTKVFNQSVKRNINRFPSDFMFRLTGKEWNDLMYNVAIQQSENHEVTTNWSQIVTGSQKHRSKTLLPYAFTEQGVAMLSGVLNSDRAISMNIAIMRAFVEVRRVLLQQTDVKDQLRLIQERLTEHDVQLSQIYDSIENLLDDKAAQRKWEERERIGFRK